MGIHGAVPAVFPASGGASLPGPEKSGWVHPQSDPQSVLCLSGAYPFAAGAECGLRYGKYLLGQCAPWSSGGPVLPHGVQRLLGGKPVLVGLPADGWAAISAQEEMIRRRCISTGAFPCLLVYITL